MAVLVCPECNRVLDMHGPEQGYCLFGHGVVTFSKDYLEQIAGTGGVIAKPSVAHRSGT